MDRSPQKIDVVRRAVDSREELPDILDAEVRQKQHALAEDMVSWIEDAARRVQRAIAAPPPPRR